MMNFATSLLRYFALILFLFECVPSSAQVEECGTPDIPLSQMDSFLAEIDTTVTGVVAGNSIAAGSPWKIGVWIYHLRSSNGTSQFQNSDPEAIINEVNTYFGGLFEFKICGVTNIDDDNYLQLDIGNNSSDLSNLWDDVEALNEPNSDKCIRMFLLGQGPIYLNGDPYAEGYAHDPLQYAKPAVFYNNSSSKTWAHELGHYFGLLHTHAGIQYVHDANTPVLINGVPHTCYQTGDGHCDTPADPRHCTFNGQCQLVLCPTALDPLGTPYNPDPTLLMSYYNCRNRFSGEQKQRMRTLYLNHPKYEFLRNPPEECVAPKYGHIERNCVGYSAPGQSPIMPLVNDPVQVRSETTTNCNPNHNKTDVLGRYLTKPPQCSITGVRRIVLPDRNFDNNPLNGVSTFDLVLINRHILGTTPFVSPFQIIAADANNSGSVTTFDIVELQRLILGKYQELPIGISWRYVPKFCTEIPAFSTAFYANPFTAEFPDPFQGFIRKYKSTSGTMPNNDSWMDFVSLVTTSGLTNEEFAWSFTGIKIGDVNCNAITTGGDPILEENPDFLIENGSVTSISSGATKRIQVIANTSSEVIAWQFGVRYTYDSLVLGNVSVGTISSIFDLENFQIAPADLAQEQGDFKTIWYASNNQPIDIDGEVLFESQATAMLGDVQLDDAFQLDSEVLPFLFYDSAGALIEDVTLTLRILDQPQGLVAPVRPGLEAAEPFRVIPYPVPFNSEIAFEFELKEPCSVRLDIFDSTGQLIHNVSQSLLPGLNFLQISGLSQYPAGFYWYELRAGEQIKRGKLTKH